MANHDGHATVPGIEDLIARLREEGTEEGRAEAARLMARAQAQARDILDAARAVADAMRGAARKDADRLRRTEEEALQPAMRDTVLDLKARHATRFADDVRGKIGGLMRNDDVLRRMILALAGRTRDAAGLDDSDTLEVILPREVVGLDDLRRRPEALQEGTLTHFAAGIPGDILRDGVTFHAAADGRGGNRVRMADTGVTLDLTTARWPTFCCATSTRASGRCSTVWWADHGGGARCHAWGEFARARPVLSAKVVPINRARFDARLRGALTPADHGQLDAVRGLPSWPRVQQHPDDGAAIHAARRAPGTVESPDIRGFLRDRIGLRTLMAALRRRAVGAGSPQPDAVWGYGRCLRRIRANWSDPTFGFGRAFPWAARAAQIIGSGDSAALERIALNAARRQAERRAAAHRFDLEAIVFYVARWGLLDRWTRYDAQAAETRFADLLDTAATEALR
jgi:V/A-type H+-transporting ATPase subunit E